MSVASKSMHCARCTIIYDLDVPREPGTNICIICADDLQRRQEKVTMYTTTTTIEVKNHTLQLNDFEIERFLSDPQELLDKLSELLTTKPAGRSNGQKKVAGRKQRTARLDAEMIECPKCGTEVKARGLGRHQSGTKCRQTASLLRTD